MKIPITPELRKQLTDDGRTRLAALDSVELDQEAFERMQRQALRTHPHLNDAARHAWAAFSVLTHPHTQHVLAREPVANVAMEEPKEEESTAFPWLVTWRIAILLLLCLIFGAMLAKAQGTSQIDVIQFQDSTGAAIQTFAAPFNVKCLANLTCTVSGSTLSMNAASGGTG